MDDRELYRQILGINEPWRVGRVELERATGEIRVYLSHDEQARWACPECGAACSLYDHQQERSWRHLDTCQFRTILHAAPPRSVLRVRHFVRNVHRQALLRRGSREFSRDSSSRFFPTPAGPSDG